MTSKRQKRPLESCSGTYSAFPHSVMDSVAFMEASHTAKALLYELLRQHNGKNNGHCQLSYGWLEKRGWHSRDVVQRAKKELIDRNLIIQTRQGGLKMGASRFAVTWLPIINFIGLEIGSKDYHPGAWTRMDKVQPVTRQAENTLSTTI